MYIVNPVRKIYVTLVRNILNRKNLKKSVMVLYRLDKNNVLLRDEK